MSEISTVSRYTLPALLVSLFLAYTLSCGDDPPSVPPPDPPVPTTLSVTPASLAFTALGDTARLVAEVHDQYGTTMSDVSVSWVSRAPSLASVTTSGLVRAVAKGMTTIVARAGNAADSAGVAVHQEVDRVVVSPSTATLEVDDTLRLIAEPQDANGNAVDDTVTITWSSGNEYVATVDSTGLVRARVRGEAMIIAASRADSGSASLTVTLPYIPPNSAVDNGTSHSLQFRGLYVSHFTIRSGSFDRRPAAIAYADFNADGRFDIFYSPSDGSIAPVSAEVYINNGMDSFDLDAGFFGPQHPGGVAPRKALPGDFNGDGRPDVFVLDHGYDHPPFPGAPLYAVLSSDSGYVKAQGLDGIIGFHHGGASADIDADGDLDVLAVGGFPGPYFLVNDGKGSFTWDTTRVEGIGAGPIYTAELVDVDLDGYVDLLGAGHESDGFPTQILWGDDSGVFSTMRASLLPVIRGYGVIVDIDVADTDSDGDKDVVLNRTGDESGPGSYRGYYLQLLEQTAARSFADETNQLLHDNQDAEADWIVWLHIVDIDEDGDLDIFADEASRGLIWKNDGTGEFRPGVIRSIPRNQTVDEGTSHTLQTSPFRIDHQAVREGRPGWVDAFTYGDFDGDGDVDVFYAPRDEPPRPLPAELYINDGNNEFSLDAGFASGNPPTSIGATKALPGDYNGDGQLDIFVTAAHGDPAVEPPYVILSSGNGYGSAEHLDAAVGNNVAATSADVDADGDVDVLVSDPPSVLLNDGNGVFYRSQSAEGVQIDGLSYYFLIVMELVDVDADGYADLLVAGHEGDEHGVATQIIWGDSAGVYSTSNSTVLFSVPGHGVVLDIDVGDTDGDGDKDIVIARTGDETGPGFYVGYHVQLVENLGDRQFVDATTALISGNRDDEAHPLKWLRLYDFDADSDVDIMIDDYSRNYLVWKNDGTGVFRRDSYGR